jgi:hypothetical protein
MDMKSMILNMYPYWLLGAGVLAAVIGSGHKKEVRIEKKAILYWIRFLGILTLYRVVLFAIFHKSPQVIQMAKNVSMIPWPLTLTVFWEDACHGLPLYLIRKWIGDNKWLKPIYYALLGMVMIEFGLGHVYQGLLAACALSFYIPYSIRLGEKYGFGTVMLGHTLFDLSTILTIKLFF